MKNHFTSNRKILFRIIILILITLALSVIHSSQKIFALPGICYYRNGNNTIKYVKCYCNCFSYKHTDKGICTRCRHRLNIKYPNFRKLLTKKEEIKQDK